MSLSYYDGRKDRPDRGYLVILDIYNACAALAAVFFWTHLQFFIADPLKWATLSGIGAAPGLFEYPYLLTWLLPIGGIAGCWLARKSQQYNLALFLALYPTLFMALMIGWFYLAPNEWR